MTKLTHKNKIKIEPSSRDSISSWLDVLTSMLAVPDAQRAQVRDELEDHLRSRVDDLLIVGKPEPEAIQIAVAELGETAELAKLITHAHTRINPRRKLMNTALIAVALGGMSFGGFTFFNSPAAPSATPSNGGAAPVVVPEETRAESQQEEPELDLYVKDVSFLMAFDQIANAFGYTADVHTLDNMIASNLQRQQVSVVGDFTLDRAIEVLKMQSLQYAAELTTEIQGDVIELLTHDEVFRRETSVKTYSIGWSNFETAQNVFHTLQEVVGSGQYSQFFTASFIGDQLVIDARGQAHQQVEEILAKAKAGYEARMNSEKAQRLHAIERIRAEYEQLKSELVGVHSQIMEEQSEVDSIRQNEQQADMESVRQELMEREIHLYGLNMKVDDLELRFDRIRELLVENEYKDLFEFPAVTKSLHERTNANPFEGIE